jgi:hypothetical protein
MNAAPRELHLRIGRVVIDGPPGVDRQAFATALARALPQALQAQFGVRSRGAVPEVHKPAEHTAWLIGQRVAERVRAQPGLDTIGGVHD